MRNAHETNKPPAMRVLVEGYTKTLPLWYNESVQASVSEKGEFMAQKNYSLAHTKWMCKYHIVFTPKYKFGNLHFWSEGYIVY